jgi:hypothetical protein
MYISARGANLNFSFDSDANQSDSNHFLPAERNEKATGSIEPLTIPAADETFQINFISQSVQVSVLATDTLQIFSNKVRDALKGNSAINADFNIANNAGASVPVSIDAKKAGAEYNSGITATNQNAELSIISPRGGQSQSGEMIKIEGLDFIQKFRFANAISGAPAELVITPEY